MRFGYGRTEIQQTLLQLVRNLFPVAMTDMQKTLVLDLTQKTFKSFEDFPQKEMQP